MANGEPVTWEGAKGMLSKGIEVASKVAGFLGLIVAAILAYDKIAEDQRMSQRWETDPHFERVVVDLAKEVVKEKNLATHEDVAEVKADLKEVREAIGEVNDGVVNLTLALAKKGVLD